MKRSAESKIKMSESSKRRFLINPESHPNRMMAQKGKKTSCEKKVYDWLCNERGLNVVEQKKIGKYFVDFYIPDTNEIYEADGAYWHKSMSRDINRDKEILKLLPGVKIFHIHFYD